MGGFGYVKSAIFSPLEASVRKKYLRRRWYLEHKNEETIKQLAWAKNNPDRVKAASRRYRNNNPEKVRKNWLTWANKNREWVRQSSNLRAKKRREEGRQDLVKIRKYVNQKRHSDPNFRLSASARCRVRGAILRGSKSASTKELIGCTVSELRTHLEQKFRSGMTWENYGPVWHVDHIRPCASFDLTDSVQQRECFHFSNLQPLFKSENLQKGAKYAG